MHYAQKIGMICERLMKNISAAAVLAVIASISNAHAAGYQLNEFSVTNLGRAFAGIGVAGDDYPLPSVMGQYNVNDKLFLGAGVYVPFGLATRYKNDSFVAKGDTGVRRSELEVVDTNLSAAYKFDKHLSLGVSGVLRYIKGSLTSNAKVMTMPAYSDFKVSGWATTMNLGAMYEFNENTRIGLAYRFKSTQRTTGNHDITVYSPLGESLLRYDSVSEPELPASWILSGYHKFAEKWGTTATVKFTQWHRFDVFPARTTAQTRNGVLDVDYRWKDAWSFSLGQDYYLNEKWTLRAGLAWDQSPVPNNTYRTNRIPDTDRLWTSFGVSYATGNHQFDLGYAHLFMMHGKVWNSPEHDANAKYRSYSNMYALQYQYRF